MSRSRELLLLDPRALVPDRQNIRADDGDLVGLANTIRQFGVLQPLGVRRENGAYRVVYGNRRRQAAIMAELAVVPCLEVEAASEDDELVSQILENVQRRQLTDIEQAEAFARLRRGIQRAEPDLSERALDERVGEIVGLSSRTIQRYLGLRELAPEVRDLLQDGALTVTQAQHLRLVADSDRQAALARAAVDAGLSAAQIRTAATALANRPSLAAGDAVELARRGEAAPEPLRAEPAAQPTLPPRPPKPAADEEKESDADDWPEDAAGDDADFIDPGRAVATADGHRVFRIRTVDAFCDAVDRLTRSLQEGDLAKAARKEPEAGMRLGLARRQLTGVERMLDSLLREIGAEPD
ncbi:MAG: ParB/RepB/Spo0J family partition protein [Chloroflexi bacterium]|nr:ParB/RepB/Spo0J family partition protein [Chloroflexota bacterium]